MSFSKFAKFLLLVTALLLVAALVTAVMAFEARPLLSEPAALTVADVQRAKDFLRRNDPRNGAPGQARLLDVGQAQVNQFLAHVALRRPHTLVELRLAPAQARLLASADSRFGWLNVDAQLRETAALPEVASLRVGRLPVPAWLANIALRRVVDGLAQQSQGRVASEIVEHVGFGPGTLRLRYQWQADSLDRVLGSLWPAEEQQRIRAHADRLRQLSLTRKPGQAVPLLEMLEPLMALARERTAAGNPAAAENRAAILTLALHATGRSWAALMPAARNWPTAWQSQLTLQGREDFAMHWLVSAVLAIEGGGPLADAIGVDKELADARDGSGFSFNDIAADRAGARIGQLAAQRPDKLQTALQGLRAELDLMPDVADLPEFMREQDFVARYGGVGAPAYQQMLTDIDARIDALPLLKRVQSM